MKTFEEIMVNENTENLKKAIWVNRILSYNESDTREELEKQRTKTDIAYENGTGVILKSISEHFSKVFDKENNTRIEKEYTVDNFGKITNKSTIIDEFDNLERCIKKTVLGDNDIPISTTYRKYYDDTDILSEMIEKNDITKVTTMFDRDGKPTIEETVTIKSGIRLITKEYSYNEQGDIIKLKRPKTFTTFSYVYDINKNILSKTTKMFNNNGKLLKKETYNYNSKGVIRSHIVNDIVVNKNVFDTTGKLLRSIDYEKDGTIFDRVFESYVDKNTNHTIDIMKTKTIYDTGRFIEKVIKSELSEDGLLLSQCEDNTKVVTHEYDDAGNRIKTVMKKVINGEFIVYRTVVTEYDKDSYYCVSTEYDKDNNILRKKIVKRDVSDNTTEVNNVLLIYKNGDNEGEEYVLC